MDLFKKSKKTETVAAPKTVPGAQREGLEFIIMPELIADKDGQKHGQAQTGFIPPAATPPQTPAAAPASVPAPLSRRKLWIVLGAAFGLLIFATLGYLTYEKYFNNAESDSPLPGITVDEEKTAARDSDKDGLSDAREKELATRTDDADSDGDGLADGDEADVYGSDPLLPDSDGDKFDDGQEVANSFSPAQNSSQKAGADELRRWQSGIERYGLHEPTPTTLQLKKTPSSPDQPKAEYQNAVYFYSISLAQVLAYRESADRTQVGIHISGATDLDPDFNTDPIFVSTLVLAGNQTLREGVETQYPQGRYDKLTEGKVGQWNSVTLTGVKGEPCSQTKTFVANKSTVIVLTQTCEDMAAFTPFYQDIVQSFKFTK